MFSRNDHTKLLDIIHNMSARLESFYALAQMIQREIQSDNIDEINVDAINSHIEERKKVIAELEKVHQDYTVLMQSYKASASKSDEIDTLEQSLRDMQGKIETLDGENSRRIEALMKQFSEKGKKLAASRKGIGLYSQKDALSKSDFFDTLQ